MVVLGGAEGSWGAQQVSICAQADTTRSRDAPHCAAPVLTALPAPPHRPLTPAATGTRVRRSGRRWASRTTSSASHAALRAWRTSGLTLSRRSSSSKRPYQLLKSVQGPTFDGRRPGQTPVCPVLSVARSARSITALSRLQAQRGGCSLRPYLNHPSRAPAVPAHPAHAALLLCCLLPCCLF